MAIQVRDGQFVIDEGDPKKSTVWEPGSEPSAPYVVGTDLPKGELPPEYAVDTYTKPRSPGGRMESYEAEKESGRRRDPSRPRREGVWYTNVNKEVSSYTPGGLNKIREQLAAEFGVHPHYVSLGRGIAERGDVYNSGEELSPLAAIVQGPDGNKAFRVIESSGGIQLVPFEWYKTDGSNIPVTGDSLFKVYDLDSATVQDSGEGEGRPLSDIGKFSYRRLKEIDKPGRVLKPTRIMDPNERSTVIGI